MQATQPEHSNSEAFGFTRRSFLRIALGSIVTLPSVAGGFLLPVNSPLGPQEAYAAEGNTTKIVIARDYEAGICVVDTKDGKHVPVPNAKVTMYSHYNKKTISGTTDKNGLWLADIREVAQKTTTDGVDRYFLYAQVDVEASGYRRFRTRRMKVEGAKGFQVPTRKIEGEKVYPVGVMLDEWDILYTKNEFCITIANDAKHTFGVDIYSESNSTIELSLCEGDKRKVISSANYTVKKGVETKEFSDFYLLEKHDSALPVNGKFYLRYKVDGKDYEIELQLTTVAAPTGASAPSSTNMTLAPFAAAGMKPKIGIPDWVPVIGGSDFEVWTPDLPVQVAFDPFGYFKISYSTEQWGYKSKNGEPDKDAWKFHPRKSFEDQWSDAFKDTEDMMKKVGEARTKKGLLRSVEASKKLSFTAMLQAYLAGRWDLKTALWRGNAGIIGTLAFNFSYSQQFFAGPVPMVFEFSFLASLSIGVEVGVATPEIKEPSKYTLDYGSTGITITIVIKPAISLGVGIKGLLSASVQGVLGFTVYVHCGPLPSNTGNQKVFNPHVVLGLKVEINVVIQAFLFTSTIKVREFGDPKFYDNWKGLKTSGDDMLFASADEEWETIIGGTAEDPFVIVPGESIAEESEFELGNWEDFDEDSEDDSISWILWGNGTEEDTDEDNWLFIDVDEEDDHYDGFIYFSDGFSSDYSAQTDALQTQSQKMVPTLVSKDIERTTDDGTSYTMTECRIQMRPETDASLKTASDEEDVKVPETSEEEPVEVEVDESSEQDADPVEVSDAYEKPTGDLNQTTNDPASVPNVAMLSTAASEAATLATASEGEDAPETQNGAPDVNGTDAVSEEAPTEAEPNDLAPAEEDTVEVVSDEDEQDVEIEQDESQDAQDADLTVQADPAKPQGMPVKNTKPMDNTSSTGSTTRLAVGNGLKPYSDTVILKDVFSDTRGKIVKINRQYYLFRIASVTIKDGTNTVSRTRVVCSYATATKYYHVLDFEAKLDRASLVKSLPKRSDLYDYDFDVTVAKRKGPQGQGEYSEIHLFIISGRREKGNGATMAEAASDQVFTHAAFTLAGKSAPATAIKFSYAYSDVASDSRCSKTGTGKEKEYHCFSCPHIDFVEDVNDTSSNPRKTTSGCILTFLDRSSANRDELLKNSSSVSVGFGLIFVILDDLGHRFYPAQTNKFLDRATLGDKTIFEMRALLTARIPESRLHASGHAQVILMRGHDKPHYYLLRSTMMDYSATIIDHSKTIDYYEPGIRSLKPINVVDGKYITDESKAPKRLVWWPGRSELLASVDNKLTKVTINGMDTTNAVSTDKPSFAYEQVGPASFGMSAFTTDPTGTFVYWPTTQEGSPGYDYQGNNADSKELSKVQHYQVLACKLRNGKFSNAFVLTEVQHDMDSLIPLDAGNIPQLHFISTHTTDVKASKADMWLTVVNNIKCATVIGVECLAGVGFPERPATFYVTVRNDGNTFFTGGAVSIAEKDVKNSATSSAKLTFSEKTIVESAFNPKGADGKLQGVEPDYALAPGQTSVYQVDITIPKGWSGEKNVTIWMYNLVQAVVSNKGLKTQAESDEDETYEYDDSNAEEYIPGTHEEDYGEEGVPFDILRVWYEDDLNDNSDGYDYELADAPIKTPGKKSGTSGSSSGSGVSTSGSGSTAGIATRQPLANTRDTTSGTLPLGLAAAGAGLLAYSRRRERLEQGTEDEE